MVHRRRRHGQDDAGDADLQGGDGGRPHGARSTRCRGCSALLRETFADDSPYSLNELIDRLAAVDLLHIDDVGAEQTTPWVLEQLYTIVNTRYEDGKAILLTTNLIGHDGSDDALRDQIGDRTVSRLYEICGDPKAMFGLDQRREIQFSLPEPVPASARRPDRVCDGRRAGLRRAPPAAAAPRLVD